MISKMIYYEFVMTMLVMLIFIEDIFGAVDYTVPFLASAYLLFPITLD